MNNPDELEKEVKGMSREELEREYLDLHEAFLAAEREIERRDKVFYEIGMLAEEGSRAE